MKLCLNKKYFREYKRSKNDVHEPAPVTYQTFIIGGEKYFQLDCYKKSIDIEKNGVLEQSDQKLQFDKETALKFISLLKEELSIS